MPKTDDGIEVLHLPAGHRFVVRRAGAEAELVYRVRGDRMVLVHTGVPDELGRQGVGGLLVGAAVRHAAAEGLTVAPWCPFARRYLRAHPEEVAGVTVDWSEPPGLTPPPDGGDDDDGDGDGDGDGDKVDEHLDEQEEESFPASDPHSDWAGPAS